MKFIKATPILLTIGLLVILELVVCYVVAVSLGHVYPFMPFISETGNHPPESCILSIINNVCSLCLLVCAWFHTQQVDNYVSQLRHGGRQREILATNKICYRIGIFNAVNMFGVTNFQEMNLYAIHTTAALSFFVGIALYMHIQSFISSHTQLCTPFISKLRRRQAQFQALMVILIICFGTVWTLQLNGKNARDLTPADNGHLCHALAAICEYAAVLNLAIYVLTFYKETLHLAIQLPKVKLVGEGNRIHDRPSATDSPTPSSIQSAVCYMLSKIIGINC